MSDALLERYETEREGLINNIDVLKRNALAAGKDLTDAEIETITKAQDRIGDIDKQLDVLTRSSDMDATMKDRIRMARGKPAEEGVLYRSAGQLFWDIVHANFGADSVIENREARRRYDRVLERAAQHMGTDAALTVPTAGDLGGLSVAPIVGAVIDLLPKATPFLSLIGKLQAPNALTFLRPRLVDPNFTTGVGVQSAQKAELPSQKFDIKNDSVTLSTVGGYLNISQQLLSLTPEAWNIILTQLQRRVAWKGELTAIAALEGSTSTVALAADEDDPKIVYQVLFEAAAKVYTETNELPTWMTVGPTGWARLGSLTDSTGRPLFPQLGTVTDFGSGPLGLRFAVTPGITDGAIWMGNALALEAYSYPFPVLEAIEPSVAGRQVSVAEALGFWRPTTDEGDPTEGNGAVKIAPSGS